jgi:hypothetical protein
LSVFDHHPLRIAMRKQYVYFVLLSSMMSFAALSHADPNISWGVTISSGTPPPPVRYEPMPPPRPAFVWLQGYWGWNGGGYVWVPGRWERERPGYAYAQPQWIEGPRGWEFRPGGWHGGGGPGAGHCPPGQRKKGNC